MVLLVIGGLYLESGNSLTEQRRPNMHNFPSGTHCDVFRIRSNARFDVIARRFRRTPTSLHSEASPSRSGDSKRFAALPATAVQAVFAEFSPYWQLLNAWKEVSLFACTANNWYIFHAIIAEEISVRRAKRDSIKIVWNEVRYGAVVNLALTLFRKQLPTEPICSLLKTSPLHIFYPRDALLFDRAWLLRVSLRRRVNAAPWHHFVNVKSN